MKLREDVPWDELWPFIAMLVIAVSTKGVVWWLR